MLAYLASFASLQNDRRAVTALEYGLIAALIAGVIVTAVVGLGTGLETKLNALVGRLS
jgi:pilus assembly protein Flp/PilA